MPHPHMASSQFTTVEWLDNLSNCWLQLKKTNVYIWEKSCCAHQFILLYHQEINQLLRYPKLFYVAFFLLQIYRKFLSLLRTSKGTTSGLNFSCIGSLQAEENTGDGKTSFIFLEKTIKPLLGLGSWLWLCGHVTGHSQHKSQAINSFATWPFQWDKLLQSIVYLFLNFILLL